MQKVISINLSNQYQKLNNFIETQTAIFNSDYLQK